MKLKTGTSSIKGTDRADKLAARRERDRARRQAKRPMKAIGKTAWQRLKIRRDDLYGRETER